MTLKKLQCSSYQKQLEIIYSWYLENGLQSNCCYWLRIRIKDGRLIISGEEVTNDDYFYSQWTDRLRASGSVVSEIIVVVYRYLIIIYSIIFHLVIRFYYSFSNFLVDTQRLQIGQLLQHFVKIHLPESLLTLYATLSRTKNISSFIVPLLTQYLKNNQL